MRAEKDHGRQDTICRIFLETLETAVPSLEPPMKVKDPTEPNQPKEHANPMEQQRLQKVLYGANRFFTLPTSSQLAPWSRQGSLSFVCLAFVTTTIPLGSVKK
jgi:hypothetical protein